MFFSFFFSERERERELLFTSRNLEKLASTDAQLRLLVPRKVSEDDKLVEYDALLLDWFLDILQDLHGEELKETVIYYYLFQRFFFCLIQVYVKTNDMKSLK
uniref:Uncharacterized protein n=1 Tax=Nelumbo nucifera TaxID=4432 RepID=A0A822YAE5_NELNU|nr:TPA_asm: hypothetical protein HUJ06_030541 [Nelumbo nucifera]